MTPSERAGPLRFLTYAAVGAIGTLAQYVTLFAIVTCKIGTPVIGSMCGAAVGALVNYILNRKFTFRSDASHASALPKFLATAVLAVAVSGLLMKLLTGMAGVNFMLSQIVATGVVLCLTYGLNSIWTFKHR